MKAIIQTGIKQVVYLNDLNGEAWQESKKATLKMAQLAGVKVSRFETDNEIIGFLRSKLKVRDN